MMRSLPMFFQMRRKMSFQPRAGTSDGVVADLPRPSGMRVASRCSASKGTSTSKRSDRYQCALASNVERIEQSRLKQEQAGQARCCARCLSRRAEARFEGAGRVFTGGWQIEGRWLVGGSTRSIASAAYRDQSQNPLTACVPSRTCGLPDGAPRLSLAENRRKLFLPRVRALLPSSLSRWPCEGYAEIGGAGVIASPSLGC
jgi:hypothetical protein